MTELKTRMLQDMQLHGYSERTQEFYLRAFRQLAEHQHKSPDQITEEELRNYFLHVKTVKKWSRTASTIAIFGIKFFFEKTLGRTARNACPSFSPSMKFAVFSSAFAPSATAFAF